MDYNIAIRTGDKKKAGTNARVYFTLYGSAGQTPEIRLDHPNYNDFERNTRDEFTLSTTDVGEVSKIRIRHDSSGKGPGWYLSSILIIRGSDGRSWEASPKRWLAETVPGDGGIDQTFLMTPASASFDLVSVSAKMPIVGQYERTPFFLDPRAKTVVISLNETAVSALVQHSNGTAWYLGAGAQPLPEGGEYILAVGLWVIVGNSNPANPPPAPQVSLSYYRLKP